jgi:hypothetical protein
MIISAQEAKKQAFGYKENTIIAELNEVMIAIQEAIKAGYFNVCLPRQLKKETVEQLKALGYKIETGGRYNEINTNINFK